MNKMIKIGLIYFLLTFEFIAQPKTEIIATDYYKDIYGNITLNGMLAPEGTLVQVVDLAGNIRGEFTTENEGYFGPMQSFLPNDELVNLYLLQFKIKKSKNYT